MRPFGARALALMFAFPVCACSSSDTASAPPTPWNCYVRRESSTGYGITMGCRCEDGPIDARLPATKYCDKQLSANPMVCCKQAHSCECRIAACEKGLTMVLKNAYCWCSTGAIDTFSKTCTGTLCCKGSDHCGCDGDHPACDYGETPVTGCGVQDVPLQCESFETEVPSCS
jgi:hypothetical protein